MLFIKGGGRLGDTNKSDFIFCDINVSNQGDKPNSYKLLDVVDWGATDSLVDTMLR